MRRTLTLFFLVLVLTLGSFGVVSALLIGQEDQVRFSETVTYGDPAVADDLILHQSLNFDNRLFWEIDYDLGNPPLSEARFTCFPVEQPRIGNIVYSGLSLESTAFSNRANEAIESSTPSENPANRAFQELFEQTAPGQEKTALIRTADYYDYYPIWVFIDHANLNVTFETGLYYTHAEGEAKESRMAIVDFFRIPVLEEEMTEISIARSEDGSIWSTSSGGATGDSYQLWTWSVNSEDSCYCIVNPKSVQGQVMDFSQIPGGYGIYRLYIGPEEPEENRYYPDQVVLEPVEMVFPLDPQHDTLHFTLSYSGEELLLLTNEDESVWLTVISLDDHTPLQRLELSGNSDWGQLIVREDLILADLGDRYELLLDTGDGSYYHEMTARPQWYGPTDLGSYGLGGVDSGIIWDGTQLAVSTRLWIQDGLYSRNCGFTLSVFDREKLLYQSYGLNSLGGEPYQSQYSIMRSEAGKPILRWKEE